MLLSSISLYELLAGVERGQNPARGRARVETLLAADITVEPFGLDAAARAAVVQAALRRTGAQLGAYDALIAGHALALDTRLVTADEDFRRVPGLTIEDWRGAG